MYDISIIIPNFNTKEYLLQCIEGIYTFHIDLNMEIIVIDDNSSDGSAEAVKKAFPDVMVIENIENKGYCYSNNRGIEAVSGRYFVLLNSDVIFIEPVLDKMIDFMEKTGDAGFTGIKLLNEDRSLQFSCRSFPNIKFSAIYSFLPGFIARKSKSYRQYFMLDMDYEKTQMVEMAAATCCIVRPSVIDTIGMMDERYFMYAGDTEWFFRAKKAGYNFYYLPLVKIVHLGSQSISLTNKKIIREYQRGIKIFYKEHIERNTPLILRLFVPLGIYMRYIILTIKSFVDENKNFTSIKIIK